MGVSAGGEMGFWGGEMGVWGGGMGVSEGGELGVSGGGNGGLGGEMGVWGGEPPMSPKIPECLHGPPESPQDPQFPPIAHWDPLPSPPPLKGPAPLWWGGRGKALKGPAPRGGTWRGDTLLQKAPLTSRGGGPPVTSPGGTRLSPHPLTPPPPMSPSLRCHLPPAITAPGATPAPFATRDGDMRPHRGTRAL